MSAAVRSCGKNRRRAHGLSAHVCGWPWAGRVACWTGEPTLKVLGRDGSDQSGGRKEWRSLG
jgi:hypothetical protein